MGEKALSTYSYEAYLALEAESEVKHEYHDGYIVAMASGTIAHGQIASNFTGELHGLLKARDSACQVFNSDVKIRIESTKRTYYPDVSVVCGKIERSEIDPHAITTPILIVEVLSESTAAFDRGTKFTHYRQLTSMREYVLINQEEATVDTYYRTDDGTWEIRTITGLKESVHLKSLDCQIRMADIYRLVSDLPE